MFIDIKKVIVSLDGVIEYYETTKNLSQIIRAGQVTSNYTNFCDYMYYFYSPGQDINSYIAQLEKLSSAIKYFTLHGKHTDKMQNVV